MQTCLVKKTLVSPEPKRNGGDNRIAVGGNDEETKCDREPSAAATTTTTTVSVSAATTTSDTPSNTCGSPKCEATVRRAVSLEACRIYDRLATDCCDPSEWELPAAYVREVTDLAELAALFRDVVRAHRPNILALARSPLTTGRARFLYLAAVRRDPVSPVVAHYLVSEPRSAEEERHMETWHKVYSPQWINFPYRRRPLSPAVNIV